MEISGGLYSILPMIQRLRNEYSDWVSWPIKRSGLCVGRSRLFILESTGPVVAQDRDSYGTIEQL